MKNVMKKKCCEKCVVRYIREKNLRLIKNSCMICIYSVWYICFSFEIYNILILNFDKKCSHNIV